MYIKVLREGHPDVRVQLRLRQVNEKRGTRHGLVCVHVEHCSVVLRGSRTLVRGRHVM